MMRILTANGGQVVRSGASLLMRSLGAGAAAVPQWGSPAYFSFAAQQTSGLYVIFGATGGIGSALVERLSGAGPGLKLVLVGQEEGPLQQLQKNTPGSVVISADATDSQQVQRVFDEVQKKHAAGGSQLLGVASLVGNVVAHSGLATSDSDLDATLRVNLVSAFHITKEAGKALLAAGQGGAIVLTSAAVAEQGIPNFEAMSAAKAGVEGLARSFAASFASHGIRVNCVAPGLTATVQAAPLMRSGGVKAASEQMHPEKRIAAASDVASALEFFLRPENAFVTGQVLAVDGGLSTLAPHTQQEYQQGGK